LKQVSLEQVCYFSRCVSLAGELKQVLISRCNTRADVLEQRADVHEQVCHLSRRPCATYPEALGAQKQ